MSPAAAQDLPSLPACNIVDEETVFWQAIGETVKLRIELKGDAGTLPRGKSYLTFEDGKEIFLGEGGKYIDDFDRENPPNCAKYLAVAKSPVMSSLQGNPLNMMGIELRSVNDIDKALRMAEECAEDMTSELEMQSRLYRCNDLKVFADDIREMNELSAESFSALISKKAPLIEVPYSTYGVDILAFDPDKRTLHKVSYSGC